MQTLACWDVGIVVRGCALTASLAPLPPACGPVLSVTGGTAASRDLAKPLESKLTVPPKNDTQVIPQVPMTDHENNCLRELYEKQGPAVLAAERKKWEALSHERQALYDKVREENRNSKK